MTVVKALFVLVVLAILVMVTITVIGALFYRESNPGPLREFYHDRLGWHIPLDSETTQRHGRVVTRCAICGRKLIQNGQGEWQAK